MAGAVASPTAVTVWVTVDVQGRCRSRVVVAVAAGEAESAQRADHQHGDRAAVHPGIVAPARRLNTSDPRRI